MPIRIPAIAIGRTAWMQGLALRSLQDTRALETQGGRSPMNAPAQPISLDTFLASLRDRSAKGVSTIALDGGELPVWVNLQESSSLVFSFSGAVARDRFPLPRFTATSLYEYVPASVIALADPSLPQSDELTLAWYAGHQGFELQKILPEMMKQMADSLGVSRIAFVGSSGGGFAALYYSWHLPGSVAVVSNPQTNLGTYIRAHRRRYAAACWPELAKDAPLDPVIVSDLCALYAKGSENTVIYLQVNSDFFHVKWHFAPFVATLPRETAARLIVQMDNWGKRGHHPVPSDVWIPWMNAALSATDTTAAAIEERWLAENPISLPPLRPLIPDERIVASTTPPSNGNSRDEQIAAELARFAGNAVLGQDSSERSKV